MSLCTMFAFEGVDDPNLLHCTHRYFGDEYTGGEHKVIQALEAHFRSKPFKPFQVKFDQLKQLGKEGDYRTVTTSERDPFMLDLKAKLDEIHPESWPEYIPHVTVGRNTDAVDKPIRDYVLMKDGVPIWSAVGSARGRLAKLSAEIKGKGQTMEDFEAALDKVGTGPRKKTPQEMMQRPGDLLDPDETDTLEQQHALDDTWQAAEGAGDRAWGDVESP